MSAAFTFEREGRSRTAAIVILLVWLALGAAWIFLEAALWIVILVFVFTLPAVYDLLTNPASGCRLDDSQLHWYSGKRSVTLDLAEIDHLRLDTRLDMSVRVTAHLRTGRKIRMPFEATPPHAALEQASEARGLRVKRFHFQFMQ